MEDDVKTEGGITGPSEPTHEATTPPDNPDLDAEATKKAEDELQKPGAGH